MTTLDLTPILTRINAAEPGPWRAVEHPMEGDHPDGWPLTTVQSESGDRCEVAEMISDEVASASERPRENAEFIAHARTDIERMAAEIEHLRAEWHRLVNERAAMLGVVRAAEEWRRHYGNTNEAFGSACKTLVAAVDALPNDQEPCGICSGYGCPDCRDDLTRAAR